MRCPNCHSPLVVGLSVDTDPIDLVAEGDDAELLPRHKQILGLIAQGKSNKEIARVLGLAPNTVKNHIHELMNRINCHDRTNAAMWAIHHGLVHVEPLEE